MNTSTANQIELYLQEHRLKNGLRLLMNEDHSAPIISFQVWYHVGSINEKPGITGISHLFEHMMFKGSENVEPEEHSRIIQLNGGTDNAFTTEDVTAYFENLPSSKLELAARLEADRMEHLRLTADTLASERQVVKEERRLRVDNSLFGKLSEGLYATAFKKHPYRRPVIGWMSDLDAISLDECKAFYSSHYAPNNATIIITGDINPQETISTVKKYFEHIPPAKHTVEVISIEDPQKQERQKDIYVDTQFPWLVVAYHIPEAAHDDIRVLELIGNILTDGHSSRLYQKIIYEGQAALSVFTSVDRKKDPGLFIITVRSIKQGHTPEEVTSVINESLEKFKKEAVTERELEKAKNQIETGLIFGLQTNFVRGIRLGFSLARTDDPLRFIKDLEKYRSITTAEIQRIAEKYFTPENRTIVRLLPKGK
ncbi:MAG: putative peptidase [Candidatus Scalindua rubra]|uniref:Putative peptidase n=1 Tax=Candidatus Scalindua rubra TaxID=1872076 RepID=A0A1E3X3X3_9BACT|nr:MAG: putative peptidase [Candidatus Scalindua rubra]